MTREAGKVGVAAVVLLSRNMGIGCSTKTQTEDGSNGQTHYFCRNAHDASRIGSRTCVVGGSNVSQRVASAV